MKTYSMETPPTYSPMDIRYDRYQNLGAGSAMHASAMPPSSVIETDLGNTDMAAPPEDSSPPTSPESPDRPDAITHGSHHFSEGAPPRLNDDGTLAQPDDFSLALDGAPPHAPDMPDHPATTELATPGGTRYDDPPPLSTLTDDSSSADPFTELGQAAPPPATQLPEIVSGGSPTAGSEPPTAEMMTPVSKATPKRGKRSSTQSRKPSASQATKKK
jgi:hypothetical protein